MSPFFTNDWLTLYLGDAARVLQDLPANSVHCVVTSPPYNCGTPYADDVDDRLDWLSYTGQMTAIVRECYRVLVPGGRLWLNVQPTIPQPDGSRFNLSSLWSELLHQRFDYRDRVIWVQDSHDGACAWGSWRRPSAPNLRGGYEDILLFSKGPWGRPCPAEWRGWQAPLDELGGDWMALCRNVWTIRPTTKKRAKHPAAYPIELPARAIRLSTWPGEVVLDPFCGTGSTIKAARALGRQAIGVDRAETYLATLIESATKYGEDAPQYATIAATDPEAA